MCLSGGLVRFVILSSICEVQSGTSCCCRCMDGRANCYDEGIY
jgi:hypothetical protein